MKTIIKTSCLLIGFFFVLSITVKDRTIFSYVYEVTSPATKYAQGLTASFFSKSINSTEKYSKKLFDNSVPKLKDSVDSKLASTLKKAAAEPEEKIMESERKELDQLIKNH